MSEKQILNMLEQGSITADEATRLLNALSAEDSQDEARSESALPTEAVVEPDPESIGFDPHSKRWQGLQQIPFAVSLTVLIITAWGLYASYQKAGAITFGWVLLLLLFLVALFATVVSIWMINAPWLHVRIREGDGRRISISLPIPLLLAQWGIQIARRYVDDQTATYLDTSAEFLDVMRKDRQHSEPIMIDVDQGDQHVQVYIG